VGDGAHIAEAAREARQEGGGGGPVGGGRGRGGRGGTGSVKEKDQKERDWDREMREVDKLLARLPEAEPTLGRGVPTVPVSPRPAVGGVGGAGAIHAEPARGRAWVTTWMRVGLGVALG